MWRFSRNGATFGAMASAVGTYHSEFEAGETALRVGSVDEARAHFTKARELAGSEAELAEALGQLGRAYSLAGEYTEAEGVLREAFQHAAGTPAVEARTRMHMGVVRWLSGDLEAARRYLEQAQAEFKRLGLVHDRSITLGNLGAVAFGLGDYQHAIRIFEEAIELQESLNDLRRVIINLSNLGECYVDLGAGEQARARLERALTLADLIDAPILTAEALRNLSRIEAEDGRLDEALAQVQRACELSATYQRSDLHAQALYTLSEIRLLRGEMDEAEQVGRALLAEAGSVNTHAASANLILGRCALARHDPQALAMLEQGLLEAQASFSKILILRFHAALGGVVDHPAIAQVHRRIALELTDQLAESLQDKALQQSFRHSSLVRSLSVS